MGQLDPVGSADHSRQVFHCRRSDSQMVGPPRVGRAVFVVVVILGRCLRCLVVGGDFGGCADWVCLSIRRFSVASSGWIVPGVVWPGLSLPVFAFPGCSFLGATLRPAMFPGSVLGVGSSGFLSGLGPLGLSSFSLAADGG